MRVRAHRRSPLLASWPSGLDGAHGVAGITRPTGAQRVRRMMRTGVLLAVIGLRGVPRIVRPRWQPLLAGAIFTVAGVIGRDSGWGVILPFGLVFLYVAARIPAARGQDYRQHCVLERELAGYCTPAQRCDIEAVLDQYPSSVTQELRDILARQATVTSNSAIPGAGRALHAGPPAS